MSPARRINAALRTATVIAVGAAGVHQLRYLIGYGDSASDALRDQGHAYMEGLIPILALLAGLTLVGTIAAGVAGSGRTAARGTPRYLVALVYAGAILTVFGAQEILEGVLFAGHPGGLAAIAAHGGLIAIPLALGLGALALLAVRGLDAVEVRLAEGPPPRRGPVLRSVLSLGARQAVPARVSSGAIGPRAPPIDLG